MGLKINQTNKLEDLFSKFVIETEKKAKREGKESTDQKKEEKDKKK